MPDYCQPRLEYSPDPLSDTTPSWVDVTAYLKDASWFSGVQRDLDQPQAGGAVFVLRNKNRDWEPEFPSGRFYPNILPLRRFRWSITADGVTRPQGVFYATSYQVVYPNPGSTESDVVVTCVDGMGILANAALPELDPPTAEAYNDVVTFDNPFAYYPLDEDAGSAVHAVTGPDANYRGSFSRVLPNPVTGDPNRAVAANSFNVTTDAKAKLDDSDVFHDAGAVSAEGVVIMQESALTGTVIVAKGPFDTPSSDYSFTLQNNSASVRLGAATLITTGLHDIAAGAHHFAFTYDGSQLVYYQDGVAVETVTSGGNPPISPDANEFLYIGQGALNPGKVATISHVAFYNYALSPARIAAHATAAVNRGYAAQTAGSRIASLAAYPLWSTASIPTGAITVAPRMQIGQGTLEEILAAVEAETPYGLFYFNDNGNPAYTAWDAPVAVAVTLGEQEVQYDDVGLVYDDQVYNQATVNRVGGLAQTRQNTASSAAYGTRDLVETDLIIQSDADAAMVAQAIVDQYGTPQYRIDSVTLNAAQQNRRTQILTREVGDTIRIKRRGAGGTANPDVIARILGKAKHLDTSRHLTATWNVSRGFPATPTVARLGVTGYAELGQTFILG